MLGGARRGLGVPWGGSGTGMGSLGLGGGLEGPLGLGESEGIWGVPGGCLRTGRGGPGVSEGIWGDIEGDVKWGVAP